MISALTALFFLYPVGVVLARALSSRAVREVFGTSRIRHIAWFSAWQAAASTGIAAVIAIALASMLHRAAIPGTRLLLGVLAAPFTLPTVVIGNAFLLLSPAALRATPWLIIAAHVYFNTGYLTRTVFAALSSIGPDQRNAAHTLGAGPTRALLSIDLPLIRRTLRPALGVVFALCFASFGTVLILGGPRRSTLDVEIYRQALQYGRLDRSAVVAIVQVVVLGALLLVTNRRSEQTHTPARQSQHMNAGPRLRIGTVFAGGIAMLAIAIPLAGITIRAFRNRNGTIGFENTRALVRVTPASGLIGTPAATIGNSLAQAFIVSLFAIICTLIILGVSYRSARRTVATFLLIAPLVVSPVTLGLGVLIGFARNPVQWRTNWFMVPILQAIICLPFTITVVRGAIEAVPSSFQSAAATLGASPARTWLSIQLPLIRRSLLSALGTAFAVALGEFGAASLLVQPARETMPVAIARLAGKPGALLQGQAALLSLILAVCTMTAVTLTSTSQRHRVG